MTLVEVLVDARARIAAALEASLTGERDYAYQLLDDLEVDLEHLIATSEGSAA